MNGVEWIDEKGQYSMLRFIAGPVGEERYAILSLRIVGAPDEAVKRVLKHMAASAEFVKSAAAEESTAS